jgi:murein DD-endopeptidase MepM/ murein hydrolase activator NlpD
LPVDNPRYDNGYGYYKWGFHDGYDITSGVPTVYSMGSGKVDSLDTPYAPDVKCAQCGADTNNFLIRIQMDAGYFIRYVHIKETRLCKGNRVQAGTVIGDYAEVGDLTPGYPHVHVGFENPKGNAISPEDYWPGSAPTQWTFGNPSDKPVQQ